ncbi:hypothetical protein F4803DRAFT_499642 [Xylaria telfairii]|nr:hypothetical protein F4803DRAFT_499642 [Xylaria telfairii]
MHSSSFESTWTCHSRIRSSRLPMKLDTSWERSSPQRLRPSIIPSGDVTAFETLVHTVAESGLTGPAIIRDGRKKYVGQGSQFIVHEAVMYQSERGSHYKVIVAVKRPKFKLDPFKKLNLADTEAQLQLHDLLLEIRALTAPSLWGHPNIVQVLHWSWDSGLVHAPMNLVLELASSDLTSYMENKGEKLSMHQKNTFCSDVAQGLDAIHQCQLVHGDLKPANILIFEREDHTTAKLADFGLSVEELDPPGKGIRLGGTEGWQAPEVVDGLLLPRNQLHKADNYSSGLVIWSIFLGSVETPTTLAMDGQQITAEQKFKKDINERENDGFGNSKAMIHKLLSRDPACRPDVLGQLFNNSTPSTVESQELESTELILFPWEFKYISSYFLPALSTRFKSGSEGFSTNLLLSMLMATTVRPGALLPSDSRLIDLLLTLAWRGSNSAKALVPNVLKFYERETPPELLHQMPIWLKDAVEGGSVLARVDLERLDPTALAESIQAFHDHGGYSNLYSRSSDCPGLHEIVIYGTISNIRDFLSSHENCNIEERTACNETPLYLACARGEISVITEMISHGASASVKCTEFGISCLHWAFTFMEPFLDRAIVKLREAGVDIDAMTAEPVPFPHYPFTLPAGTALHWAIATHSHAAVKALIEQGASLGIRNRSDPYRYDRRVRVQDCVEMDQTPYSEPERPTQGLSPLDYAAMQHDPFVFETLVSLRRSVNINATDEEGFTVLHRLSNGYIYYTREGSSFSLLLFQGSPDTLDRNLRRMISAIKSLGGDLEVLTTPWTSYSKGVVESRTALMLAVESGLPDVVRALLDAGACPNTKNEGSKTSLFYLSDKKNVDFESAKLLISAGANVTHRDGHGKGKAVLCVAALHGNLDLVGLLLSCGASIEERTLNSDVAPRNRLCSVFGLLAQEWPFEDAKQVASKDQQVAKILEKYLFTGTDANQQHQIMEHDVGGRTLLYRFFEIAFPYTVKTLLRHGAQVGPQAECCLLRDPRARPLQNYETPLYAARNYKKRLDEALKSGERTKVLSEYNAQCGRMDTVVKSLMDAGWT